MFTKRVGKGATTIKANQQTKETMNDDNNRKQKMIAKTLTQRGTTTLSTMKKN